MTAASTSAAASVTMDANMAVPSLEETSKDRHESNPATRGSCAVRPIQHLPRATSTSDGTETSCPWCRSSMEDATVRVGALNAAWQDHQTDFPGRSDEGVAECELVAECPACLRPSMLALGSRSENLGYGQSHERRYLRLVPVRTEADAAYLGALS